MNSRNQKLHIITNNKIFLISFPIAMFIALFAVSSIWRCLLYCYWCPVCLSGTRTFRQHPLLHLCYLSFRLDCSRFLSANIFNFFFSSAIQRHFIWAKRFKRVPRRPSIRFNPVQIQHSPWIRFEEKFCIGLSDKIHSIDITQ